MYGMSTVSHRKCHSMEGVTKTIIKKKCKDESEHIYYSLFSLEIVHWITLHFALIDHLEK